MTDVLNILIVIVGFNKSKSLNNTLSNKAI